MPMSAEVRRRVLGKVSRHESYGFYVDIGDEHDGLVVITMVVDDPTILNPGFPPIDSTIEVWHDHRKPISDRHLPRPPFPSLGASRQSRIVACSES